MLLNHWLRRLALRLGLRRRDAGSGIRAGASPRGRRRNVSRLAFERLEDRTLMAVLTVTTLTDNVNTSDGLVSLREAVHAANNDLTTERGDTGSGADQIVFASNLVGELDLTLGEMTIVADLTITGRGARTTVIDAQAGSRVFNVFAVGTDLTLEGLTLKNGRVTGVDQGGGAIHSQATGTSAISILNCALISNSTIGASGGKGGAIATNSTAVNITNSTLSNNSTAGVNSEGGAIFTNDGAITVVNSTLGANAVLNGTGLGGGAVFTLEGDVTIVNSTIARNSANIGGGIGLEADSGGESLAIVNSIVADNTAAVNPDFTAPGTPGTNLNVEHSLIGRGDGTSLSATSGSTPDIDGNFVGGTTAATRVSPGLTSLLANNGGSTDTYRLFADSLAINRGDNSLATLTGLPGGGAIANDQRGAPFYRQFGGTVDMGAVESQALQSIVGNTANFLGGSGNDVFQVQLGTKTVIANSFAYALPGAVTIVNVEGSSGRDTLFLVGTSGAEVVNLYGSHNSGYLTSSSVGVTGGFFNMEVLNYLGNGGSDAATLYDAEGNDKFVGRTNQSYMQGQGNTYINTVVGVANVTAIAHVAGFDADEAYLFDTSGNNTFTASGTIAEMSGTGLEARRFEVVIGYASTGTDDAYLFGGDGNDTFVARQLSGQNTATITGSSRILNATGFTNNYARGDSGSDTARLYGRSGVDTLSAGPADAGLTGAGYSFYASQFEFVIAAASGPGDIAFLSDSTGDDRFIGRGNTGTLIAPSASFSAVDFSRITIRGNSGGTNRRIIQAPTPTFQLFSQGTWV